MFHLITENALFKNQIDVLLKNCMKYGSFQTPVILTDRPFAELKIHDDTYCLLFGEKPKEELPKNILYCSSLEECRAMLSILQTFLLDTEQKASTISRLEQELTLLKSKNEDMENHSETARKLQKQIYKSQTSTYFNIDLHYQYYQSISGDLFFLRTLKDRTYIVFGDVTHHGVRAGLYGTSLYTLLGAYFNTIQENFISLPSIVAFLNYNATLFGMTNEDTIHAFFLEINHRNNKLRQYCFGQAGEPILLINKDTKEVTELAATHRYPDINNYMTKTQDAVMDEFQLPQNYALFLYTDGLRELFKEQDKEDIRDAYSIERMKRLISSNLQDNELGNILPSFIEDCNNFSITDNMNDLDDNHTKYIVNALDDVTMVLLSPK